MSEPGTLCPQCPHMLSQHGRRGNKRGVRCLVGDCPCLLIPPLALSTPPSTPRVDVPAQDQREADLANVAERLRAAVAERHTARVMDIVRAAWDAGFTARDRVGKGAT